MVTIYVDGNPYQVPEGRNLLEACLSQGLDLPYFCWHPAFGSAGACRQCAVKQFKDENDTRGRIVMACMTPATDGTRISIADPDAKAFRAAVIEWLMANHPHDCPVCDEGGECHLQDMTAMSGHVYRDHRFPKRTHRSQDLGPFIAHQMNRCIACYRCVRFYRDYAGGSDLDVFGAHDHVYFGRFEDGTLESEFSGNLVEICPTGVFTDKTLDRHYARKWDLQTAPSVCVLCGAGCNTLPGERYGTLRRIRNRYHHAVNGYFLCDRGRYGYEFVNSPNRLRQPLRRSSTAEAAAPVSRTEALTHLEAILAGGEAVIGIGSPRASLEDNFALRRLVGPDRFACGLPRQQAALVATALELLRRGPARSPSIWEIEQADAVFVLGEDVTQVMPRAALALRQSVRQGPMRELDKLHIPPWQDAAVREAVQDERGPLFIAAAHATRLDDIATLTDHAAPDDLARLGFAVAHLLDSRRPAVDDLGSEQRLSAAAIAADLAEAQRPLVIAGFTHGSPAIVQAAASVAFALCRAERPASLAFLTPECNTLGAAMMGGMDLEAALERVRAGAAQRVIVLENDLYRYLPASDADALLAAGQVVALDYLETATTRKADLVLPTATFAEGSGTLVNYEGRAQRFFQVFTPDGELRPAREWLAAPGPTDDARPEKNLDAWMQALAAEMPAFAPILTSAPPAAFRVAGMKIPRQSPRYSGRTAMHADQTVNVPPPPPDPDSALAFSMEGFDGTPPGGLVARYWAPGWNSVQALNKFQQETGGTLRGGDPGERLIEPGNGAEPAPVEAIPPVFRPQPGAWRLVYIHHLFGSEPLSLLTPGIDGLAPPPYVGLNPVDAEALGLAEGQTVRLDGTLDLPIRLLPSLMPGLAGVPAGVAGLQKPAGSRVSLAAPDGPRE